jgi:hypothetical protein
MNEIIPSNKTNGNDVVINDINIVKIPELFDLLLYIIVTANNRIVIPIKLYPITDPKKPNFDPEISAIINRKVPIIIPADINALNVSLRIVFGRTTL